MYKKEGERGYYKEQLRPSQKLQNLFIEKDACWKMCLSSTQKKE